MNLNNQVIIIRAMSYMPAVCQVLNSKYTRAWLLAKGFRIFTVNVGCYALRHLYE